LKRIATWVLVFAGVAALPFFAAVSFWLYVASTLPPIKSVVVTNESGCLENPQLSHVSIHYLPEYVTTIFVVAEAPKFLSQRTIPSVRLLSAFISVLFGDNYIPIDAVSFSQWVALRSVETTAQGPRTIFRQIQLLVQSDRVELAMGKKEILEVYFNQLYFAKGAVGITCASHYFFHKSPVTLSIAETALLAALARGPKNFDPFTNPVAAEQRRNTIIDQVLAAKFITSADAILAKTAPLLPK
jgi:membrane carboxypeptidase/penicillin-binding protein